MNTQSEADRYRTAKAIALAALECAPEKRTQLIDERCGEDAALRREVEWLMAAAADDSADEVPERFQSAARDALRSVSLEVPLPRNYRLIRRLGHGGTGIVYLAERVDGNLHQPVAFKLLNLSESRNQVLAQRFAAERGILSRLNHPSIARLIDGGVTAEGRPFLATEYVEGEPIDRWCARAGRTRNECIALFLKVCEAVDYAHRHMVIHRDLKPSNILVTEDGQPKLLDFGVASLLDARAEPAEEGNEAERAMTPAWASPEQIRGEDLSAATDVYSLGVLLYHLIGGRHPFAGLEDGTTLMQAVLSSRFPPVNQVADEAVSPDLAAVIDRAMRASPAERYASVRALADDLERWQESCPVTARDGGWLHRTGLFVRRHRMVAAAVAGAVVLLAVYLADREAQLDRIASERDRAEAVTSFMNDLLAGANSLPARGGEVTVREVLDLGRDNLAQSAESSPAVLGSIYVALGEAYNALGLGERAVPLLEQARSALFGELETVEQARILAALGAAYDSAGRAPQAIAVDEQALAAYADAGGERGREVLRVRIRKLRNQSNLLEASPQQVVAELEEIVEVLQDGAEPDHELLFEARAALVGAHVAAGDGPSARENASAALALSEAQFRPEDPRRLRGRYVHATAVMLDDPQAAVELFAALIDDYERMVGPSQRLANTIGNYGVALSRLGRIEDSMDAFERAARMIEDTAGRDHYLYRLSITNLAALQLRAGDPQRAAQLIEGILSDLERRHRRFGGVETMYRASALEVLGGARVMQGQLSRAAESYRMALASLDEQSQEDWTDLRARIAAKLEAIEKDLSD